MVLIFQRYYFLTLNFKKLIKMKKHLFTLSLIFSLLIVSCGPKINPDQKESIEKLTNQVDSVAKVVNALDSAEVKQLADNFFDRKNYIQNKIVDTAATFITSGVLPGDIATYTISGVTTNTVVTNVISETQLQVAAVNLDTFPVTYIIYTPDNTVSLGTIPAVDMNTIHERVYKLVQPSSNYHMGAGSPLRLKCASNPTQGNGNMFVNIFYRVLTIGTSF